MNNKMENGWCSEAKVVRVVDGDTIELEVTRKFKLRLRDIDVYEKKTEKGEEAKKFVEKKILNKPIKVFIPSNQPEDLMDINSFSRLVGDLYYFSKYGGYENLADVLKVFGYEKTNYNSL